MTSIIDNDRKGRPARNSTYTQAGVLCFVIQESDKFEKQFFVESSLVKVSVCV
jgi:hypothetical protein